MASTELVLRNGVFPFQTIDLTSKLMALRIMSSPVLSKME